MSLEDTIFSLSQCVEENTRMIRELSDAVTVLKNVLIEQSQGKVIPKLETILTPAVVEDLKKEEVPNDSKKSNLTIDTSKPSSDELRQVTYDDVKNVTIAVSKIDKAKAVAGLARFGVTTAKALNESQWPEYVVYMKKVAAGDLDPEASHE